MASQPEVPIDVYVGDIGRPLVLSIWKPNRRVARNLTGYNGRILFWNLGAAIHTGKPALVDGANGFLILEALEGDEFNLQGSCFAQGEIANPDWYVNGSKGNAFHIVATDVVEFRVLRRPT